MTNRTAYCGVACVLALSCSRVGLTDVVINEIYSTGPGEDWVELYNRSDTAQDIGGLRFFDDPQAKFAIPYGTHLEPRGHLVLNCSEVRVEGLMSTGFGLSAQGETLLLEDRLSEIDKVTFPALNPGQSYARVPDGGDQWAVLETPSAGR